MVAARRVCFWRRRAVSASVSSLRRFGGFGFLGSFGFFGFAAAFSCVCSVSWVVSVFSMMVVSLRVSAGKFSVFESNWVSSCCRVASFT